LESKLGQAAKIIADLFDELLNNNLELNVRCGSVCSILLRTKKHC
jgi:hypothetical protein